MIQTIPHTALIFFRVADQNGCDNAAPAAVHPRSGYRGLLFSPRIKRTLKGAWYVTLEAVRVPKTITLKEIPVVDFQGAFNEYVKHWQRRL